MSNLRSLLTHPAQRPVLVLVLLSLLSQKFKQGPFAVVETNCDALVIISSLPSITAQKKVRAVPRCLRYHIANAVQITELMIDDLTITNLLLSHSPSRSLSASLLSRLRLRPVRTSLRSSLQGSLARGTSIGEHQSSAQSYLLSQ